MKVGRRILRSNSHGATLLEIVEIDGDKYYTKMIYDLFMIPGDDISFIHNGYNPRVENSKADIEWYIDKEERTKLSIFNMIFLRWK